MFHARRRRVGHILHVPGEPARETLIRAQIFKERQVTRLGNIIRRLILSLTTTEHLGGLNQLASTRCRAIRNKQRPVHQRGISGKARGEVAMRDTPGRGLFHESHSHPHTCHASQVR